MVQTHAREENGDGVLCQYRGGLGIDLSTLYVFFSKYRPRDDTLTARVYGHISYVKDRGEIILRALRDLL